jgi:hypothetical protein
MTPVERQELAELRVELLREMASIRGALDTYIQTHGAQHMADAKTYQEHLVTAAVGMNDLADLKGVEPRVQSLEDWRLQVTTAGMMVRVIFGTSILSAIGAIAAVGRLFGVW